MVIIGTAFKLAFPDMIMPFEWAITFLVVGLLGLLSTVVFAVRSFLAKPEIRQPQLQAYLQTRIREDGVRFSFEIKNLGPGDVEIRSYEISTAEKFKNSTFVDLLTFVPELGSVMIDAPPVFARDIDYYLDFGFNFIEKGSGGLGTAEYTFTIPDRDTPSSSPTSWKQSIGHLFNPEVTMRDVMKQFLQPEGTVVLIPARLRCDGRLNNFALEVENRKFYFELSNFIVIFETYFDNKIHRVTGKLPENQDVDAYFICLLWNDKTHEMAITISQDGELKKFSDCETINLVLGPSWNPMPKPNLTAS